MRAEAWFTAWRNRSGEKTQSYNTLQCEAKEQQIGSISDIFGLDSIGLRKSDRQNDRS
jgi:hypothetical protein